MRSIAWLATTTAIVVATVAAGATDATAQTLAGRIDAVRDGTVQMTFRTRPGVCGDGRGSVWIQDNDRNMGIGDRAYRCVVGPVRVTIGRADGQTVSIRQCVACSTTGMADGANIGEVNATEAARYLLAFARTSGGRNADDAIAAAAFSDAGNLGPELTQLIRDESATQQARKQALFWLGQTGESTQDLIGLDGSLKSEGLREQYTFVLSQRRDDPSLDKLMDIARRDPNTQVRTQAMFWLGQSHDARAVQFFKDILRR
jgi:hypothetical protein